MRDRALPGDKRRQVTTSTPVTLSRCATARTTAPELSTDVAALAHQLGAEVILDDVGIHCVTPSTARQLIAQRDAAEVARKAAFAADYAASSSWLTQRGQWSVISSTTSSPIRSSRPTQLLSTNWASSFSGRTTMLGRKRLTSKRPCG